MAADPFLNNIASIVFFINIPLEKFYVFSLTSVARFSHFKKSPHSRIFNICYTHAKQPFQKEKNQNQNKIV